MRTIAYSEIEVFAIENLLARMEGGQLDAAPIWSDLKSFPWAEFSGKVDILSGGYPCQPFSSAGKRAGKEDPRHLWPWIADGIRILRPRVCFFENVEGHISLGLSSVISDLEELGYKVSWGIFSAREVGAPHQRKRVFILAHDAHGEQRAWSLLRQNWQGTTLLERCGSGRAEELANSADQRPEWSSIIRSPSASEAVERCGAWSWPSRPGEPQHGWEPPRVVGGHSVAGVTKKGQSLGNANGVQCTGSGELGDIQRSILPQDGRPQASDGLIASSEGMGNASNERCGELDDEPSQTSGRETRGHADGTSTEQQQEQRQTQPPLGGNPDGTSDWMDYAELYTTCDNRTDELRLLGNGVVPATAERAFRTLLTELLTNKQP